MKLRVWRSGSASPCQGEGREFKSRHPLTTQDLLQIAGRQIYFAPIAQLDRASVFGTAGWGFKSLLGHQT